MSIPKVIHYCWFGGAELPDLAIKCIESWKKYCPGYEIKEWNETNFDLFVCRYIQEAYEKKKWAFVSDYARFKILYEYGGLYFDTDVELIKNIEDIVANGPFMGCEKATNVVKKATKGEGLGVAPGLGLGTVSGLQIYKELLLHYESQAFINEDGTENTETVVIKTTRILEEHGYKGSGGIEKIDGITIYPPDYFCPKDFRTGKLLLTDNTRSIHHYTASWLTEREMKWHDIETWIGNTFGVKTRMRFKLSVPGLFLGSIFKYGWARTIKVVYTRLEKVIKK